MIPRQWAGETAVVAGTGPSLSKQDLDCCIGKARVLVVNDAWSLAPWADALYACDKRWWDHNEGLPVFAGQKWTQQAEWPKPGEPYGINVAISQPGKGLGRNGVLHRSHGSGYQAINLAFHFGAVRILLLGFDMTMTGAKKHFFGDYPPGMNVNLILDNYLTDYIQLGRDLMHEGVEVINCTLASKLTFFPKRSISECF